MRVMQHHPSVAFPSPARYAMAPERILPAMIGTKMHSVTFYPVGNGDTSLIETKSGKLILMDFYQRQSSTDPTKPEFDVAAALRAKLVAADRNYLDVVAFTHADLDHINGSTNVFHLEHAKTYQGDGRIVIKELWVPAALLLEIENDDVGSEELMVWGREARHRLKHKTGIKVFSHPAELTDLITLWDMPVAEIAELIVDAGTVLNTFTLQHDGVEFFVHSPWMQRCDESSAGNKGWRNGAALVFNVRFNAQGQLFDYLVIGDATTHVLDDLVSTTQRKNRADRLQWDLLHIPHHCSYLALADIGYKGSYATEPTAKVKELLNMGKKGSYMICSSEAFQSGKAAEAAIHPPHIQARRTYEAYLQAVGGQALIVTGEHGGIQQPFPVVVQIKKSGLLIQPMAATL
jgi:hypothetical protein